MRKTDSMLKVRLTISSFCLLLVVFSNCGSDDAEPSEADRIGTLLRSGTWKVKTVIVDDVDKTSLYEHLALTVGKTTYSTSNGVNVWPASGGWNFTDESATFIRRDDGVVITVREVTTTKLVLSFDWRDTTLGPGRTTSMQGTYVFTFEK
jgi:hypothetical protein